MTDEENNQRYELRKLVEVNGNTEIRCLDGIHTNELAQILDQNCSWKKLMSEIRVNMFDLDDENWKYTPDEIKMIEDAGRDTRGSCTLIFLEEWGTAGKKRPTVKLLHDYLDKHGLWRAADHISTKILKQPVPDRSIFSDEMNSLMTDSKIDLVSYNPFNHPSTERCEDVRSSENISKKVFTMSVKVDQILKEYKQIQEIPYEEIKMATSNFDESRKVGKGAFGKVYFGTIKNECLAVKLLNDFIIERFEDELAILSQPVTHPKLLPPVAVSFNQSALCIVYPFMSNGSLEDRLALKTERRLPLSWQKRISISYDIIEGLEFLHNLPKQIIHRDIKPSNILLDSRDTAKIGDFGLVRSKKGTNDVSRTSTIKGTEMYMAPESFYGVISPKMDIFSYGLVTLELMTGLPIQGKSELTDGDCDHLRYYVEDHVENNHTINGLLDTKAGSWDLEISNKLYILATECLSIKAEKRPNSTQVKNEMKILVERSGSSV